MGHSVAGQTANRTAPSIGTPTGFLTFGDKKSYSVPALRVYCSRGRFCSISGKKYEHAEKQTPADRIPGGSAVGVDELLRD
jgi:hypothetical protein